MLSGKESVDLEANSDKILKQLKNAGFKMTDKRKAIIDLVVENKEKYLSAKDVFEHIKPAFPTVSYDTVYRTLATLLEEDILEHMEFSDDAAKYRLKCQDEHHHHLVCIECGSTFPMDDCPMDVLTEKVGDFKVVNHRFEIYGYCQECQTS